MAFPRTTFGPAARDELAALSTAPLSDRPLGDVPALDAPSPPGSTMTIDGRGIYVRHTQGPVDAPATWYIHGLEGMSQNWDRLSAALAPFSAGFAPDLPGSGQSEPPTARYSLLLEADTVARLVQRACDGPVHLVGNSRGGVVATLLAAKYPNLVRSLTLISPAVPDFRLTRDRGADPRLGLVMLPGMVRAVDRMLASISADDRARGLAATCFGEPEALTSAEIAAAASAYRLRSSLPWARRDTAMALRSLIRAQIRPGEWSFARAAARVRVPVLVVWGTRDRLVDARLAAPTAGRFADSRLLMLVRTGHVAQMERPEPVARAMVSMWDGESGTPR